VLQTFIKWLGVIIVMAGLGACTAAKAPVQQENAPAQAVFSPDAVTRYENALAFMMARDDKHAIAAFTSLAEDYPAHAGPMINLGILYRRNDRPDAAIAALTQAIIICATCAPAYNELGILQRQQGRFDDAESAYLKSIEIDPDYALAFLNLGVLYDLYQRRFDDALENYERYVEISRDEAANAEVEKWIVDLRRRVAHVERVVHAGGSS